jgi:flagellar biosynthesis protein FlhF
MDVKSYQAFTMAEALGAAKRDLGADAVILETRTFKRGGLLGVGRRTIFELTATTSDRADVSRAASAKREPPPSDAGDRAGDAVAQTSAATRENVSSGAGADQQDLVRTKRLAQAMLEAHQRRALGGTHSKVVRAGPPAAPGAAPEASTAAAARREPAPVARRFILTAADQAPADARRHTRRVAAHTAGGATAVALESGPMQQELSAIRTMVGQVLQRQAVGQPASRRDMPAKLFETYLELIGQDLSEELADRIVSDVRGELRAEQWEDGAAVRGAVVRHLSALVPAADPAIPHRSPDDRPLTIALIGPTGVGKTTTLAKLAASFKLHQHRKVGLVTCDTYRIAAVDQLRTYANIIGLPLEVALTPAEMQQAVYALREGDVILIDTAGRGPNDRSRLDELRSCLTAADPHEVHLVLSSTSSQRALMREAEAFAALGADRVVLTKLDEAVSFGVLVNVMQAVGKQLSFITTGQEVPDHIEVGRPRRLAELVLGAALHA